MKRRNLVALVAAVVFVVVGVVAVSTVLFLTHTGAGREKLRTVAVPLVSRIVKGGSIYIGSLGGNFITEITIDSIDIRDKNGELFLATGKVTLGFDPRDLVDQRLFIRRAVVEHPYVHIVQRENGTWNFKEIFAKSSKAPIPKELKRPSFGDFIVIDSARTSNGTFLLTMPWHVDTSLTRAERDSSIHEHLTNPERSVAKTADGYARTYAWRNFRGILTHGRIADPDSTRRFGRELHVDSIFVDEYNPTFRFRNVRGVTRIQGDSVFITVPHFNLPASTGSAKGKVWWGSNLPVRYDLAVRGDSVSLDDVNWVYPTLPRTGGGSLDLFIRNDPKNLRVVDFILSKMEVNSTKSRLVGDMSFGTGARDLLVRNVDLQMDPVDFDLLRTLAGGPFSMDWQGRIYGTVKARGGPLRNFYVDDARATYYDKHVKGATSRLSGHGELDIFQPAFTVFHGFRVDVASLDLRTIEYLNPTFPRLGGTVSGTALLDSSWLDVRFSDADVLHHDGPAEPSRITGSGRVTYGLKYMTYDVALEAQPLSLTTLARSYPNPLRGLVTGPIRVKGIAPDLEVEATLQNASGALSYTGRLDADSVDGYGARGRGQFTTPSLGGLLATKNVLAGPLGVHYDVDVSGVWPAEPSWLNGSAALEMDRTVLDSVRYFPSSFRFHFVDGVLKIDSARVRSSAATIQLAGGLALPKVVAGDSIRFSVTVDSLGGLRPYLSHPDTTLLGAANTPLDSLSGSAQLTGYLTGGMDLLNLRARLRGSNLYIKKDRGDSLIANVDLQNVLGDYKGTVSGRIDGVTYAGVRIDTIGARLTLEDSAHQRVEVGALTRNGASATARGNWVRLAGRDSIHIGSFGLNVGDAAWRLAGPSAFVFDSTRSTLEALQLRNGDSASISLKADVPVQGEASGLLRLRNVPLRDLGLLAQLGDTVGGILNADATITGTKATPRIVSKAEVSSIAWHDVKVDRIVADATAANARVNAGVTVVRNGQDAIKATANLPIEVSLFATKVRNEAISGTLEAQPTDLSFLNVFLKSTGSSRPQLAGQFTANVTASGTWLAPVFDGRVSIKDGSAYVPAMGTRIVAINGGLVGVRSADGQDSIRVQLEALGDKSGGRVVLNGFAKNLFQPRRQQRPISFALGATEFHAFNKRTLADLYVSTTDSLRLTGSMKSPVLTGSLNVDRGSIFLADREIARKQAVEIFDADTTIATVGYSGAMLQGLIDSLKIPNVTITIGDVRLRSTEANVKLVGELRLNTTTARSTRTLPSGQLLPEPSLEGTLRTAGGTYQLNLGLVRREFQVLNDGTVTFDGPWQNPNLDITAQFNVRRTGDRDLGVFVKLQGPLVPYPGINFSSDAGYDIPPSDLISYLMIGRPGFDFAGLGQGTEFVSSVIAPTLSAVAADKLRQSFGSTVDVFRLQLGAAGTPGTNSGAWDQALGILYGSTIGVEQQFKSLTLSTNVGFCQLQQGNQGLNALALGAKAEYRLKTDLAMKLSYDPSTSSRQCTGSQGMTGFVQTPWQLGLSLSHVWRF